MSKRVSFTRRFTDRGMLAGRWGLSDHNRKVRYYELTGDGRAHLASQERDWSRYVDAVDKVLAATRHST